MGKFLGFDSSTQSLSAFVIDTDSGEIILDENINFGDDFPQYKSQNGFLENSDLLVKHSDPLMWCDALDLLLGKIKKTGFDLSIIDAVSGSGQQHGTVYLKKQFADSAKLDIKKTVAESIKPMLSRLTAPIWMDSSTSEECREIAENVGGNKVVQEKTGSPAIERFSGPQIRKFYKKDPDSYKDTGVIHLVSSFMASLLCGKSVAVDYADASGMNLLNLHRTSWDEDMLNATAPELKEKLPEPVPSNSAVGTISEYYVKKYGFKSGISVYAWSGDNPSSIVGVGACIPGNAVISLGTSDTFFASIKSSVVDPDGYGHIFCNPAGNYMCLICFKNGSLAREKVKEQFNMDWKTFDGIAEIASVSTPVKNLMLPFYVSEITPLIFEPIVRYFGDDDFISGENPKKTVPAIIVSQLLNMKQHSLWIDTKIKTIKITGGASKSDGICQFAADIFQTPVERLKVANSAALGAAMRAANSENNMNWNTLAEMFCLTGKKRFIPNNNYAAAFAESAKIFSDLIFAEKAEK